MNFYVYVFSDPLTNVPFYVGKGKGNRWKHHLGKRKNFTRGHKHFKIEQLKAQGLSPLVHFAGVELTEKQAFDLEIELIAKWGREDKCTGILFNLTDGGEGAGGRIWTDKDRKKQGEITKKMHRDGVFDFSFMKGIPKSEEVKTKISNALIGIQHDEKRKNAISNGTRIAMEKFSKKWLITTNETSFCVLHLRHLRELGLGSLYGSFRSGKPISKGKNKGSFISPIE